MKTVFTLTLTALLLLSLTAADAQQYVHIKTLRGHTDWVGAIAFKDNNTLISGADDDTLRAWNVNTGSQRWQHDVDGQVYAVAIPSHDPFFVAYGGWGYTTVRMRYTDDGDWRDSLEGHTGFIWCLAFKPRSYLLASGSNDETIRIWDCADINSLRHVRTLRGHTDRVNSVAWSPDGSILASASDDGTVRLWNPSNGVNFAVLRGHRADVTSVAWSADGSLLASGSFDETIRLWDPDTERTLRTLRGHTVELKSLAFHPNGHLLASGSRDETIRLWNPNTGAHIATFRERTGANSVAWSPNGSLLASGNADKTIRIREALTVDVTGNGTVTINDLLEVAKHYGKTVAGGANRRADVNNDGRVDIKDIIAVAKVINANFAQVAPTASGERPSASLEPQQVQAWVAEARGIGADAEAIAALEQLLAALTHPEAQVPAETALFANYPNPFNPETWIPYQLAAPAEVTVSIYSAAGTLVRRLALGELPAGVYWDKSRAVYWDGKNAQGEAVASGVYFYTLTAGDFTATQKMVIRK